MGKKKSADKCYESKPDCFALGAYNKCKACVDTGFIGDCPFYKTAEQRRSEHVQSVKHLEAIGRHDLVVKYGQEDNQPRVWCEIW